MRKTLLIVVPALILVLGGYGILRWWQDWRFQQSTDDAYIQSDITLIAPTIEGTIKEVRVQDNERVKEGQILFLIDDADFVARVHQAEAVVANEEATVATLGSRRELQQAVIDQADATAQTADIEVTRAQLDRKRYISLLTSDVATRQRFETAEADARKADAAVLKARAALAAEKQQLAVLDSQKREEEAKLMQARASLQLARNQLDDTIIRAPVAGVAGNRAGQIGQYVKPGTQLASLVPLPQVYVTANFKETQLTQMRPGQAARNLGRRLPRPADQRPHRELCAGKRGAVLAAAAGQRHRQFHQDRPARAGAHRTAARRAAGAVAAAGPVGDGHGRYPRDPGRQPPRAGLPAPPRPDLPAHFRDASELGLCVAAAPRPPASRPSRRARQRRPPAASARLRPARRRRPCATGLASWRWYSGSSWRSWMSRSSPAR